MSYFYIGILEILHKKCQARSKLRFSGAGTLAGESLRSFDDSSSFYILSVVPVCSEPTIQIIQAEFIIARWGYHCLRSHTHLRVKGTGDL